MSTAPTATGTEMREGTGTAMGQATSGILEGTDRHMSFATGGPSLSSTWQAIRKRTEAPFAWRRLGNRFVLTNNEVEVDFSIPSRTDDLVPLHYIGVVPGLRRQGLCRAVHDHFEAWVRQCGYPGISILAVRLARHALIGYRVFPSFGYDGPVLENRWGDASEVWLRRIALRASGLALPSNPTIQQVLATPGGRGWWQEEGWTLDLTKRFDRPPSA